MIIEELVMQAQNGDKAALENLCKQFAGLIEKSAHKQHLRMIYEDALSVAYVSFIEAVKTYNEKFRIPFAGYAKSKVRFAVWNLFKQERRHWQNELSIETETQDGVKLLNNFISKVNIENEIEVKLLLKNLIKIIEKLPAKQKQVIFYTIFCEKSLTEAAKYLNITPQAVYGLKKRAIKFINKYKDLSSL